jgi:hypothetical protein
MKMSMQEVEVKLTLQNKSQLSADDLKALAISKERQRDKENARNILLAIKAQIAASNSSR